MLYSFSRRAVTMTTATYSTCLKLTRNKPVPIFRVLKQVSAVGSLSQNSMVANRYSIRYGSSMNRSYSNDAFRQCVQKQANGETIIRSPYQDIDYCDKSFGDFMFSHLDKYKDLEMMVRFFLVSNLIFIDSNLIKC